MEQVKRFSAFSVLVSFASTKWLRVYHDAIFWRRGPLYNPDQLSSISGTL